MGILPLTYTCEKNIFKAGYSMIISVSTKLAAFPSSSIPLVLNLVPPISNLLRDMKAKLMVLPKNEL